MMLQQTEGVNKGAGVFHHWKVHNGCDVDAEADAVHKDAIVEDGAVTFSDSSDGDSDGN
jgi:hypothetical protein